MSTLKELRKEASSLGIKRYSRMTKSQLEAEIAKITDNSQHEKPQTCSIPDTTNITPADDTQEDTQNAQPENVKFVVGKTYLCGLSVWGLDWDGYKATHYSYKITITGRKGNYLTIHDELYGETAKRKLFANEKGVEYIRPKGSYGAYRKLILFADYPTVEPEIPTTLPPDVANNESDNTAQPAEAANTECELGKWLALQDHWKKLAWLANGGLGTLSYLNATPETVAESIAKGISAQEYEITKQFCNCEYSPSKFRAMLNCFTMSGINKYLDMLIHFHRPQNFSKNQAIEFLVTTYIPLWEKEQAKRKAFTAHLANTQSETTAQPATTDNTSFTVVPSEHIQRPEYTVYPDTITDECPYTVIPACDIPAHNPAAAVVPYADARNIRNFFHILAIYIRMWLAMNIPSLGHPLDDFPDGLFYHYPTRKSPRKKIHYAEFEVGSSYTASCYSHAHSLQSFTFLVTGRVVYSDTQDTAKSPRKDVLLYITCNSPTEPNFEGRSHIKIHREHGVEVYDYCGGKGLYGDDYTFSFRADKRDNFPYPFKDKTPFEPDYMPLGACTHFISRSFLDNPDPEPAIIPAIVRDITPQLATQKLDRLWLFADDMKDYNMIRRKNKSLIDACDSEEAITALMLTLDTTDILNQANYCRVHLCTGIPHSSDHKSDEQLASEFAAVIMKRRAKKLKASQPKTQQKPGKKEPAPASAPELNGKLIDTANLHGNDWRNAHRHNISVITSCLFREAVTALLLKVSVSTIREIGGQLGTLNKHVKGNKSQLIARFVDRLFEIRSIRNKKTVTTTTTPHNATSTQHKGFKIVQLKNRQLGFIFSE